LTCETLSSPENILASQKKSLMRKMDILITCDDKADEVEASSKDNNDK